MGTTMRSRMLWISTLACWIALVGLAARAQGSPKIELLDQAAVVTPKWRALMQMDVTRAGARLISVGERGAAALSDDNGKSWRQVRVPVSTALTRVRFVDAKIGWAIGHGGVILKTVDGGESWSKQLDGNSAAEAELSAASAEQDGSEATKRRIEEAKRLVFDGPDKPFLALQFMDASRGVVVGAYGLAFRTTDGGTTWQSVMGELESADRRHLYSMLTTAEGSFIAGEQGVLVYAKAADHTYGLSPFPVKSSLFGLLDTGNSLMAYGLKGAAFRRNEGTQGWSRIAFPPITDVGQRSRTDIRQRGWWPDVSPHGCQQSRAH
jgi:photosystem II stability/assembly factor-like uncharacterized protein